MAFKGTFVYHERFDSEPIADELLALSHVSRWRGLVGVAFDWAVVVGAIAGANALAALGHWYAWIPAIVVVGARQHALLILMHDAAHYRLFPSRRWNERLANWLCAYPHFASVEGYRRDHLAHHFFLNTDKDPNWTPKIGKDDWAFPMPKGKLAWIFLKEVCGFGVLRLIGFQLRYLKRGKKLEERKPEPIPLFDETGDPVSGTWAFARKKRRRPVWPRLVYYAVVAATITALGGWRVVALGWLIPLFTVLPSLLRIRVIAEHYGLDRVHDGNHSRNYECTPLERFLFAPHNVWYHLDHHLFPAIPYYHLPAAHELLLTLPRYRELARINDTLLSPTRDSVYVDATLQTAT